jgi:hypothetical protein
VALKKRHSCLHAVITTADAAVLLHIDERTVQRATKAGFIQHAVTKLGKPVKGRFILGELVSGYIQHLRKALASDPQEIELKAAKLRKALADAERAELELALFKNQLHTSESVLFVWSARIGASRKRLLAVATRLAPHLVGETDQKKIYDQIYSEITAALEDVAGLTQKDFAKQNREFLKAHRSNGE